MEIFHCEREPDVAAAVRSECWPGDLRSHAAACEACRDAALIAEFLIRSASAVASEALAPDAGLVWFRAQLRARREAAARAVWPIAIAEKAGIVFALVAISALLAWFTPTMSGWTEILSNVKNTFLPFTAAKVSLPANLTVFLALSLLPLLVAISVLSALGGVASRRR